MEWKHSEIKATDLKSAILEMSGMTEEELLHPQSVNPYDIENIADAVDIILDYTNEKSEVYIVGDYDADGITSTAILVTLLRYLGAKPRYHLPRRFSEGYGISEKIIEKIPSNSLLITVDNGIAAHDAISAAKAKGITVVVLDHHLPGETLPCADIIVDPHINPDNNGYVDYCGAGLAFKVAEMCILNNKALLNQLEAYAAIGTIADVMPLTGDNRRIVKEGLAIMNERKNISNGLNALLEAAGIYEISEHDIAFKLGPMLNAPGRMLDNGAEISLRTLICPNAELARSLALDCDKINGERKAAVAFSMEYVELNISANDLLDGKAPLVVFEPMVPEGIVGIITGRLAEKYSIPCFVFTENEDGILKGSGRSIPSVNLKDVVDSVSDLLIAYGGHEGAAGVSVSSENYDKMVERMKKTLDYLPVSSKTEETVFYDIEIDPKDIPASCKTMKQYGPFGEGCPAPVICVRDAVLSPRYGAHYKVMGKQGEHLKLLAPGFSAIAFNAAEKYRQMCQPLCVNLVGTLSENVYQYNREWQIELIDFNASNTERTENPLMEALRKNGTI